MLCYALLIEQLVNDKPSSQYQDLTEVHIPEYSGQ